MNRIYLLAIMVWLFSGTPARAAEKYFHGYCFEVSVLSPSLGFEESPSDGAGLIRVRAGDEYSIVVKNPLPVRVAAAVTVDGLNTIDGKRTTPADGQKWIIEPYSSITIQGWQTSSSNSRRFIFTREGASYARWKERRDRRSYTENLGIIGVAYFWSSAELARTLSPQPFSEDEIGDKGELQSSPNAAAGSRAPVEKRRAGTGMGRHEWHPVQRVNFYYDTGMFSPSDALTIRYELAEAYIRPLPFEEPGVRYRYPGNYAPEMP